MIFKNDDLKVPIEMKNTHNICNLKYEFGKHQIFQSQDKSK